MRESKSDLIIKFSGRIDNLLIKHKGRVILNYNGDPDLPEERPIGYLKNQGKLGVTSSFAKAVNTIPVLKAIWHKSYFKKSLKTRFNVDSFERIRPGKAIAFNKIVAANNRYSSDEHPTKQNIIIPPSREGIAITNAVFHRQGIDFTISANPNFFDFPDKGVGLTGAAILCAYNPKRRANKKYDLIPKAYTMTDLNYRESNDFSIAFEPEEAERIWKYKNLILYFTIVVITGMRKVIKWSDTTMVELENETRKGANK
jgi:hypothetical protein